MPVDKRYQVFISSTFVDLVEERQAALRAVLELDQMPAGMELFPAGDDSAWQLIADVIDGSDYYVLIVGGRYGSVDETGLGYTEREYDYAVQQHIPVIPLLNQNPDVLPRERTETSPEVWERLKQFRAKVEKDHTCVYWSTTEDLKSKIIVGLTASMKRHPRVGWLRADQVPAEATIAEVLSLRNRIADLELDVDRSRLTPPPGTEELEQGDDTFDFYVNFRARTPGDYLSDGSFSGTLPLTWDELFAAIAPTLIQEASTGSVRGVVTSAVGAKARTTWNGQKELKGKSLDNFTISNAEFQTALVQFRALGLIQESVRTRSVKDNDTYWKLTPYGDHLMTQLRALRRVPLTTGTSTDEPVAQAEAPGPRRKPTNKPPSSTA